MFATVAIHSPRSSRCSDGAAVSVGAGEVIGAVVPLPEEQAATTIAARTRHGAYDERFRGLAITCMLAMPLCDRQLVVARAQSASRIASRRHVHSRLVDAPCVALHYRPG